jgi:hypothetical protein
MHAGMTLCFEMNGALQRDIFYINVEGHDINSIL